MDNHLGMARVLLNKFNVMALPKLALFVGLLSPLLLSPAYAQRGGGHGGGGGGGHAAGGFSAAAAGGGGFRGEVGGGAAGRRHVRGRPRGSKREEAGERSARLGVDPSGSSSDG